MGGPATRQRVRLSGGTELSFITAGEASKPAVLLVHGFPSSARMFRDVVPELSQAAYVIAPDLPGFGDSDVLPADAGHLLLETHAVAAASLMLDFISCTQRGSERTDQDSC